jgi:hypothetical protein
VAEDLTRYEVAGEAPIPAPGAPGTPPLDPAPEPTATLERRHEPETLVIQPPREWQPGPHAGRFLLAYAALGLILGAAVIGFAVVTNSEDAGPKVAWSSWKPSANGSRSDRIHEIAAHVARNYRLPSRNELVTVIPRAPEASSPPVTTVAVANQAVFSQDQEFKAYSLGNGMLYNLCGIGTTDCSIREGTPSIERHRLLRREALELALYTFHYVDDVDSVLAFLPPRAAQKGAQQQQQSDTALFFRKDDPLFKPLIEAPLAVTIAGRPRGEALPRSEADLIDGLTAPVMYRYSFQRTSDGQNAVAVLQPFPTG